MPDQDQPEELASLGEINDAVHDPDRLNTVRQEPIKRRQSNPAFDTLSRKASDLLNAPLALISLVEEDHDLVFGQSGLPVEIVNKGQIDASPSFCQLTVTHNEPVIIGDAQKVPTLRLFPSVANQGVRAYLGVPLRVDGQPIGNFCLMDFTPRKWTDENVAQLQALADEATEELNGTADSNN